MVVRVHQGALDNKKNNFKEDEEDDNEGVSVPWS